MKDTSEDIKLIIDFLADLAVNNNREWFNANKERYVKANEAADRFTQAMLDTLSELDPLCGVLTPASCRYRIYRDTRFSNDKTPYKDHIGIYINPPGGKKSIRGGYYIHLQPRNCFVAGGIWCPDSKLLKRLREGIYDNVEEYLEIIEGRDFRKYFTTVGEDLLKTAPKGFPKDWEHIDLLRPKSFTAYSPFTNGEELRKDFPEIILHRCRILKPFNDFHNYAVDNPSENEGMKFLL